MCDYLIDQVSEITLLVAGLQIVYYACMLLAIVSSALLVMSIYLSKVSVLHRVTLRTVLSEAEGYITPRHSKSLIGKYGITKTPLRPAGKILIEDTYYDAKASEGYIHTDKRIVVVNVIGSTLIVQHENTRKS